MRAGEWYCRAAPRRTAAHSPARCPCAGFNLDRHAFEAVFTSYDPDNSQSCSITEFMGLTVFLKSTAMVFTAFDPHKSGKVALDYNQFVYAAASCR